MDSTLPSDIEDHLEEPLAELTAETTGEKKLQKIPCKDPSWTQRNVPNAMRLEIPELEIVERFFPMNSKPLVSPKLRRELDLIYKERLHGLSKSL